MKQESRGTARAYIRRRGRLTAGQARALGTFRERYGAEPNDLERGVGIEIGFGMGRELLAWAREEPARALVGIEMYEPGVGSLLLGLEAEGLTNVRVIERPAQEVLAELPDGLVEEIRIFFPDPWPKKRHFKRRLVQAAFVQELARILCDNGIVRLATDWSPYADWIRDCFRQAPAFFAVVDQVRSAGEAAPEIARAPTKFEARGRALGHDIHDLIYRRALREPAENGV